jgi:hypothetical protein
MNEFDKLRVIVTLKKLVIHHQYWELAAYLRDKEKTEKTALYPSGIDLSNCIPKNITPSDYLYMIVVLDEWESYKISLVDEDHHILSIRELVEGEFIHIIRQIKLSSILK